VAQFYGLADQEGEEKLLSGGGMHCGLFACEGNKAVEWDNINVMDGFESEFDGIERYRSYYQGYRSDGCCDLLKSDSSVTRKIANWGIYTQQSPTMQTEDRYNVLFPIKYHEESKKLFAGRTQLWVKDATTLNDGDWRFYNISNIPIPRGYDTSSNPGIHYNDSLEMRCFAIAQYDTNIAYVCYFTPNGKGKGVIQYTTNGGIDWTDVTPTNMEINYPWPSKPISP